MYDTQANLLWTRMVQKTLDNIATWLLMPLKFDQEEEGESESTIPLKQGDEGESNEAEEDPKREENGLSYSSLLKVRRN